MKWILDLVMKDYLNSFNECKILDVNQYFQGGLKMKNSQKHEEALLYTLNFLKQLPYIEEIWLYGSYARKNFRNDSDIDLYVVLKQEFNTPKLKRFIRSESVSESSELPEVDIHFGSKKISEFKEKKDYFDMSEYIYISNIKKDGILLWQT